MSGMRIEAGVDLECYILRASVATPRYPYILPVLQHLDSNDGDTDAEALSADLFPGLVPLSQKLLDICAVEGQVKRDQTGRYKLTDRGRDTLGRGKLFARGAHRMWKIHYAACAALPEENRVVRLEIADRREAGYDHAKGEKNIPVSDLPSHIIGLDGKTLECMSGKMKGEFRLHGIHRKGKRQKPSTTARLLFCPDLGASGAVSANMDGKTACAEGKASVACTASSESGDDDSMALPNYDYSIRLQPENARAG